MVDDFLIMKWYATYATKKKPIYFHVNQVKVATVYTMAAKNILKQVAI